MLNPFKEDAEPHPIMGYVSKLENDVRVLKWRLMCHRLGSFVSGMVIGAILTLVIAAIVSELRGIK